MSIVIPPLVSVARRHRASAASAPFAGATAAALAGLLCLSAPSHAAPVHVTVTVENLAPANGIAFAPLHFGFNSGVFDAFNVGAAATEPIISVAEGGSGSAWQPAFAAADPTATRGTVGGLLLAGATATLKLIVDPLLNPFFTFASMVVPSNDFFIGNDSPTRYRVFDAAGNLAIGAIDQLASDIWDAGSEAFDPDAAAFTGNNGLRTPQNGVVSFNFSELEGFNGRSTGAGYVFTSGLQADTAIYRISFEASAVPEPGSASLVLASLLGLGWVARRRKASAA